MKLIVDRCLVLAISPNTNLDKTLLTLNPLCSCVLETESTSHFFLRCQNYTTLRRALMTDLKNINDVITSLNENDLRHVILYGNKNFDSNINISILTATIKFIKVSERFDQPLI